MKYLLQVILFCCCLSCFLLDATLSKPVRVAVGQILSLDNDIPGNFLRIEDAIVKAKAQDADIIVFPEAIVIGWMVKEAFQKAHPIPGATTDRLGDLAKKHDIYIAIGICEKNGTKLYDSGVLLDNLGNILLKHRKINIWCSPYFKPGYTPGHSVTVVKTKFGTIGMLICADTFENSILERMKALSPDLLLVPYGWQTKPDGWPQQGKELVHLVEHVAKFMGAPAVGASGVGEVSETVLKGNTYGGWSVSADSMGKAVGIGADRNVDVPVWVLEVNSG